MRIVLHIRQYRLHLHICLACRLQQLFPSDIYIRYQKTIPRQLCTREDEPKMAIPYPWTLGATDGIELPVTFRD